MPGFLVAARFVAPVLISRLLPLGDVHLLFDFPAYPFATGNKLLPIDVFSCNHDKAAFDLRADFL